MNPLTKALDDIQYRIPMLVLQIAFKDDLQNWRQAPLSLREMIMNKLIRPRVLMDIDIVGGQVVIVPLEYVSPKYIDTYTIVYQVPGELVNYRTIMSVLNVGYMPYAGAYNSLGGGVGVSSPCGSSDLMSAAQRVSDSYSNIPAISNATAEIIGDNTVLIRDQLRITNNYQLRCVLGNEELLNNIQPRVIPMLTKVIELAVKSYIYNTLTVKIDQAYLTGGQELGSIKNIVESYSDAEQMYQDYMREQMSKAMFFNNNSASHERFIKLQIVGSL